MTAKRTELEKRAGSRIRNAMKGTVADARFGRDAALPADRRAQRERDRALGLVPFAIKLPRELVEELRRRAQAQGGDIDAVVAELLRKAIAG
jgi:hypothetical protein